MCRITVSETSKCSEGVSPLSDTPMRVTDLHPETLVGYARISTLDQNPQLQLDALTRAGCIRIFTDEGKSGSLDRRPELDACLDWIRAGDTLTVWKLDRLGRSLRHLIDLVTSLGEQGIGFRSLTEGFDTTTPGGKLVFHILGALAEFERGLLIERTMAGLETARANGKQLGRPRALTPAKLEQVLAMHSRDVSIAKIAEVVGTSRATIYRALEERERTAQAAG